MSQVQGVFLKRGSCASQADVDAAEVLNALNEEEGGVSGEQGFCGDRCAVEWLVK